MSIPSTPKNWFEELVAIMARLRSPQGCPWDREQTHETLKRYLVEEAAELHDALAVGDDRAIADELGDVLLQVIFHAQIADEAGRFSAQDVARGICEKLIRRHPHVFGDADVKDAEGVVTQWEVIKKQERAEQGDGKQAGTLSGVPRHLPALHRAYRIQKKAAGVGFDWPEVCGVMAKIHEEIAEVDEALEANDPAALAEEVGDLLFAVTNLGRFLGRFPEDLLHAATDKFVARFEQVEDRLARAGKEPAECSLEELETLWQQAKE